MSYFCLANGLNLRTRPGSTPGCMHLAGSLSTLGGAILWYILQFYIRLEVFLYFIDEKIKLS